MAKTKKASEKSGKRKIEETSTKNKVQETRKDKKMRISEKANGDSPKNHRESQVFACQYCQKNITRSRVDHLLHEKFCSKYGKFIDGNQCLICKAKLKNRKGVRHHMRTHHKNEGTDPDPKNDSRGNVQLLSN